MGDFTAKGALQVGLGLIRRRPWLVLLWAALLLVQTIALTAANQEYIGWVRANVFAGRPAGLSLPYVLARLAVSLILSSILWASAFRALLRPAARAPLGFGGEELFVLGAWTIPQLLGAVVSVPLAVLVVRAHGPFSGWLAVSGPAVVLDVLALLWGAIAAVWAFERLQIAPIRCWRIARGRFWLLAGLIVGLAVLQHLASAGVQDMARALSHRFPGDAPVLFNPLLPRPADLTAVLRPPALLRDVLGAAIRALEIALVAGVVTSAYRAPEPQAASFSAGATAAPS